MNRTAPKRKFSGEVLVLADVWINRQSHPAGAVVPVTPEVWSDLITCDRVVEFNPDNEEHVEAKTKWEATQRPKPPATARR